MEHGVLEDERTGLRMLEDLAALAGAGNLVAFPRLAELGA